MIPDLTGINVTAFVTESNRIEGIRRDPTRDEVDGTRRFLELDKPVIADLEALVSVYAPGHRIRDREGLNVRVGAYAPPPGGPNILRRLKEILHESQTGANPWEVHVDYETLHPFTDGNGRSGRALWAWQMVRIGGCPLGFLHHWYYQTLAASEGRKREGGA